MSSASIAKQFGFNIDECEDVKAAVSEACVLVIRKLSGTEATEFQMEYKLAKSKKNGKLLEINLKTTCGTDMTKTNEKDKEIDEMSMSIIRGLVDSFECKKNGIYIVKEHKRLLFE
jgi:hypothetical protein